MPENSPPRSDFDIFADNGFTITINRPSAFSGLPRDELAVRVNGPAGKKFESSGPDPFALMDAAMAWIRGHDEHAHRQPAPPPAEGGIVYIDESQRIPMTRQVDGVWFWQPSVVGVNQHVARIERDTDLQNLIYRLGRGTT